MKLFEKLGVSNEAEALKIVDSFNEFTGQLAELTGQEEPAGMVGVIAAWKAGATSASDRKAEEDARAEAALTKLAADGVTHVDAGSLREVYASKGLGAFWDAVDSARTEHTEAHSLIDELVAGGRLAPAAKGAFEKLFASAGMIALKAAAEAIPAAAQVSADPAPVAKRPDPNAAESLTEAELWAAKATGKTPEEFAKAKADEAKENQE